MRRHHLLALLPLAALLGAPFVANRVEPRILGLPFLLAWCVGAVLLTSATMAVIHALDRRIDRAIARARDTQHERAGAALRDPTDVAR
jgi:4-hydroxybenzoate polyprenyltransferase